MKIDKDKIITDLLEEHPIHELVKFSDLDLQEKLKDNSFMITKYQDLYDREKFRYEELEDLYDKLAGIRYDYYRFEIDKNLQKIEIEKYYLPKDAKMVKMKRILRRQEVKVRFFELCVKGFINQGWRMKTWVDNARLGGY